MVHRCKNLLLPGFHYFLNQTIRRGVNYGIEVVDLTERNLKLQVDLRNSGMKLTGYNITKVNNDVFIDVYGKQMNG